MSFFYSEKILVEQSWLQFMSSVQSMLRVSFFWNLLLSELAALGKSSFTTSWSAEDHVAAGAHGGDLSVGEDGLNASH